MTVTVLASSLLLALVVTARPILPNTNDVPQLDGAPLEVRNALQSVFQARIGQPEACLDCQGDKIQIHVTSAEEQDAVLSGLDDIEAIKVIVPLDSDVSSLTDEELKLYELISGANSPSVSLASLNGVDENGLSPPAPSPEVVAEPVPAAAEAPMQEEPVTVGPYEALVDSLYDFGSGPLITLTLSCLAASLALGCLVGILYLSHLLCGSSDNPLEQLPQVEKAEAVHPSPADDFHGSSGEKLGLLFLDVEPSEPSGIIVTSEHGAINEKVIRVDEAYYSQYDYSDDEDSDELDEKFHDAFASPYMQSNPSLTRISVDYSDPDFLPLPVNGQATPYSTPPHTPPRPALRRLPSQLSMRESRPSTPVSKPAWSLRAADAPALGLCASPSSSPMMRTVSPDPVSRPLPIPGAFMPDEECTILERPAPRRAYRAPMPELDIAFAMQLRPGLGLGSDPAWLVRFLMTMFGWMTVLIGGTPSARRSDQRAIMA